MSENVENELIKLRKLDNPYEEQRERIKYLQSIEGYYRSDNHLPYKWVEYLLNNRDQIKEILDKLQIKQGGITPLPEIRKSRFGISSDWIKD